MSRYIKRGHVWLLIEKGYVVVVSLSSGIYLIEVYCAENGASILSAKGWARSMDIAKTRGRDELDIVLGHAI